MVRERPDRFYPEPLYRPSCDRRVCAGTVGRPDQMCDRIYIGKKRSLAAKYCELKRAEK